MWFDIRHAWFLMNSGTEWFARHVYNRCFLVTKYGLFQVSLLSYMSGIRIILCKTQNWGGGKLEKKGDKENAANSTFPVCSIYSCNQGIARIIWYLENHFIIWEFYKNWRLYNWNLRPTTISCLVRAPTWYDYVNLVFRSYWWILRSG
jgi:hypothetical protein